MTDRRVIAIGLDGFELSIAEAMMKDGRLPRLKKLDKTATRYLLDHGDARETGLAWEHFATGQEPDGYERWSAVEFDPSTYTAVQAPTRSEAFLSEVEIPTVAFDVPYMQLKGTAALRGMANWGAHDPGVAQHANPSGLTDEIFDKFGDYPAKRYIYGFVWPDPDAAEDMASSMIEAMEKRTEITSWLLKERLPDWTLAITVVAELHSVAEALWHGIDENHPLHGQPSAAAARRGVEGVYEATDRMIARLQDEHPDAELVIFSMHGMGPNRADIASMCLLPEVMYRRSFGRPYLHARKDWTGPCPQLGVGEDWNDAVNKQLGIVDPRTQERGFLAKMARRTNRFLDRKAGRKVPASLGWMPAARYAPFWPKMDAFALPAFYDGQIRVNLIGRERAGRVSAENYPAFLDGLEETLLALRDPYTGEQAVAAVDRPLKDDPFAKTETRCDLKIMWTQNSYALEAAGIGRVGPVPQRRTGGHTGAHGYALIDGKDRQMLNAGVVSSFDMVPTILNLAGIKLTGRVAGQSLVVEPTAASS
ncbi:MAG: alkaline phosphatase family protein [Pseudomonadota bacterium]